MRIEIRNKYPPLFTHIPRFYNPNPQKIQTKENQPFG